MTSRFDCPPQPLQGQPERIEQIARANCDPPPAIISQPIPAAADSVSHRPQRIGRSAATAIEPRIQSPFTRPVMPLLNALQQVLRRHPIRAEAAHV